MFGKFVVIQPLLVVALSVCAAQAVTIDMVAVGNPGNAGELSGEGAGGSGIDEIVGAVNYEYAIGKYEVTAGQYCEFLNAVAATDPYGLYSSYMDTDYLKPCKIQRLGSPGSYIYSVAGDWANRPVNYVSWYDAARFCNWLTTGDTESGVYMFDGTEHVTTILDHETAAATLGNTAWFIPTENEWYKAAYHKNDGATANYWDYPTGTNAIPSNELSDPDPGNNATFNQDGWTIGSPYYRTEVGAFENSSSPYGTFDQGGNVQEWNETAFCFGSRTLRGLRGGSWDHPSSELHASSRGHYTPSSQISIIGFRVACITESVIPIPGDLNDDGLVGSADLDLVRGHWLQSVEPGNGLMGDATGDGFVNSADLDLVRANWGRTLAAVPEPSVLLVVISSAGLLGWRLRRVDPPRRSLTRFSAAPPI